MSNDELTKNVEQAVIKIAIYEAKRHIYRNRMRLFILDNQAFVDGADCTVFLATLRDFPGNVSDVKMAQVAAQILEKGGKANGQR